MVNKIWLMRLVIWVIILIDIKISFLVGGVRQFLQIKVFILVKMFLKTFFIKAIIYNLLLW